ncbi:MAG: cobalt ECF transporter T component CbiQ [Holophagaceae bacterium]|nr:cobalt ECF transporter T component CbiQ [Holophagaceae bacterium]
MLISKIHELYGLEQLSSGDTCVHRLNPTAKLITTIAFILTVVSFNRYAIGSLIPFVFFPTILMALSDTPYLLLFKRFLIALPFCIFAGIANIVFDSGVATSLYGIDISYGTISFIAILLRAYLCVMSVMILISVTPLSEITNSLRCLRMPNLFVVIFEMVYRYFAVILDEANSMYVAYSLRSCRRRGIKMNDMGSFIGQLLLRSFDRAERVYSAMKCRGYAVGISSRKTKNWRWPDIAFCVTCCLAFVTLRVFNIKISFFY